MNDQLGLAVANHHELGLVWFPFRRQARIQQPEALERAARLRPGFVDATTAFFYHMIAPHILGFVQFRDRHDLATKGAISALFFTWWITHGASAFVSAANIRSTAVGGGP